MAEAALAVNPEAIILVHGGPIAEPDDAAYVLARARHCHGFYGASSMERVPVERALRAQVKKFKAIKKTFTEVSSGT
jgi:predicted TIM-barrel enzyme